MGNWDRKTKKHGFFDREVIGVISEWMWVLIIITLLALLVTVFF